MRVFNRISVSVLLATLVCAPVASVAADESETESTAERSFSKVVKDAQKAYSKERYDRAIRLLVRAYSMRSNARLLFNIAKSYDKKNRCGPALVYYRAYINHPGTEKKLMDQAESRMDETDACEAYTDDLAGRLVVGTTPDGAEVHVDGKPHGETPTEVPMLEPGTHELKIEKKGYEPVSFELEMKSGDKKEINQILQEREAGATGGSEPPSDPGGRRSVFWPIHPAAIALGAGGLGGLSVGMVVDFAVIPNTDEKRRSVPRGSSRFRELTDRRDTQVTVALIGYIGGALLLTSGVVWHTIDVVGDNSGSAALEHPRRPTWQVGLSPTGAALEVEFY